MAHDEGSGCQTVARGITQLIPLCWPVTPRPRPLYMLGSLEGEGSFFQVHFPLSLRARLQPCLSLEASALGLLRRRRSAGGAFRIEAEIRLQVDKPLARPPNLLCPRTLITILAAAVSANYFACHIRWTKANKPPAATASFCCHCLKTEKRSARWGS
jgi:hypothetical protein